MTMHRPNTDKPTPIDGLQTLQQQLVELPSEPRKIPPLEHWHPTSCGDMNLQIKANNEWWHEGRKVTRQSLVSLFAKVLWAQVDEQGQVSYYLKTPVEKWRIQVDAAPLLITQVDQITEDGKTWLQFVTSQGDVVTADAEHPIQLGLPFYQTHENAVPQAKQAQQPYLLARQNGDSVLYGLLHRSVFYHLLNFGEFSEDEQGTTLHLQSGETRFDLTMSID